MEFDSHPADGESVQPSSKILPDLQQDPRTIKRENDSMDDFEHLEHEGSPLDESTRGNNASSSSPTTTNNILDVTSVQLIDVPRIAKGTELMDVASKLERNILDTSIPVDERILQPVPATPPPSADFQKFEQQPQLVAEARGADAQNVHHRFDAQDYDSHQQRHRVTENENRQVSDPKAATMAFMDTERGNIGAYNHNQQPQDPHPHLEDKDELLHHQKNEEHPKESFVDDFMEDNKADVTSGSLTARLAPDKMSSLVDHEDNVDELAIGAGSHFAEKKPSDFSDFTVDKKKTENDDFHGEFLSNIESSVIPGPQKSPEFDFLADEREETKKPAITNEGKNFIDDDTWNVVEKPEQKAANFAKKEAEDATKNRNDIYDEAPTKPLPPLPKLEMDEEEEDRNLPRNIQVEKEQRGGNDEKFEMSNDFMGSAGAEVVTNRGNKHRGGQQQQQQQQSGAETGDSEFESAPEQSPAKSSTRNSGSTTGNQQTTTYARKIHADDIAPKEIFTDMGLVAALIYWRQPEKTGVVFGAVLGVLLSLAYFSLISVFAYLSLLTLTATVGFRVYKTVMQAIQKTSDGHPFKDILDVDLALPSEKVHEVADVAVAHANAAVAELRRLFLVEDFIDSLKFGVVLWCFTYLGSWFNGMTLIIIGVVALFTLPKVYETNKAQIDQNVALVHGKINEITAKVKAAIPLGKKAEPAKEE